MRRRVLCFLLALFSVVSMATLPLYAAGEGETAEGATLATTSVVDDLKNALLNGEKMGDSNAFAEQYPSVPSAGKNAVRVTTFVESGWRKGVSLSEQTAELYLYLYNPSGKAIATDGNHKVTIGTIYEAGEDNVGLRKCTRYAKFGMELLSVGYDNRLIKARIKMAPSRINGNGNNGTERLYTISEVELQFDGDVLATASTVATRFMCSGYAEDGSYTCKGAEIEIQELQVKQTHFRYANRAGYEQEQINTVYFAVDNSFFAKYGGISAIHATWYEAQTTPIFATENAALYEALAAACRKDASGVEIASNRSVGIMDKLSGGTVVFRWAWNRQSGDPMVIPSSDPETGGFSGNAPQFGWLFHSKAVSTAEMLAYYEGVLNAAGVSKSNPHKNLSLGLYTETADSGRRAGNNDVRIYDDTFTVAGYRSGSALDQWLCKIFGVKDVADLPNNRRIQMLDAADVAKMKSDKAKNGTKSVCEQYLISEQDLDAFLAYATDAVGNGKRVVLFRFASTSYYTAPCQVYGDTLLGRGVFREDVYVAKETLFLDFDVIDLTFGKDKVIPAVSSPINVISGVDPPRTPTLPGITVDGDLWQKLYDILRVVLGVALALVVVVVILNLAQPAATVYSARQIRKASKPRRRRRGRRR